MIHPRYSLAVRVAATVTGLLVSLVLLSALFPVDNSDVLRHRCDDHGDIYRAAKDEGRIIAVTCNDGTGFTR